MICMFTMYDLCVQLLQSFERCKELGALAQVHAENGDIIHTVS